MNGVSRMDKLNSEFKKEIYDIITRKLKNPFITEMFSILRVQASKDLRHARVFISIFSTNKERAEATLSAIRSESKRIRHELALAMRIRTVPELEFLTDDSMAYSDKIEKLFKEINEKDNKS